MRDTSVTIRVILGVTVLHLLSGLSVWAWWLRTGDFDPVRAWFDYAGTPFLVIAAAAELGFTLRARARFEPGQSLRTAWTLIGIAAGCRLCGSLLAHVLAAATPLNPLRAAAGPLGEPWHAFGLFLGGGLPMLFLTAGLGVVLRVYRALGYVARLRWPEYICLAAVVAYTIWTTGTVAVLLARAQMKVEPLAALNWITDPLLCLLVWQALRLRRAVAETGGGLIARCWVAYAAATLLTTAGDVLGWATSYQLIPYPVSSLAWYVWYPAAAAFVLAPAYQLAAIGRADASAADI